MKGIALATESIVIIILAVVVLVALLLFFSGIFGPGEDQVKLAMDQAHWCAEYIKYDLKCSNPDLVPDADDPNNDIKLKLEDVCNRLGFTTCDTNQPDCVQKCCKEWCQPEVPA